MKSLIIHPKNQEQLAVLEAFAKAFKINYNIQKNGFTGSVKDIYDKEFIESIERGEEDIKAGRITRITNVNNIWESIL